MMKMKKLSTLCQDTERTVSIKKIKRWQCYEESTACVSYGRKSRQLV